MLHGLRTNSPAVIRSGLRAVESYARRPTKPGYKQVFQTLTLAIAYDAGIRRLKNAATIFCTSRALVTMGPISASSSMPFLTFSALAR